MIKKSAEFSYSNKSKSLTLKFTLDPENVKELKEYKEMLEQSVVDIEAEIKKADVL